MVGKRKKHKFLLGAYIFYHVRMVCSFAQFSKVLLRRICHHFMYKETAVRVSV